MTKNVIDRDTVEVIKAVAKIDSSLTTINAEVDRHSKLIYGNGKDGIAERLFWTEQQAKRVPDMLTYQHENKPILKQIPNHETRIEKLEGLVEQIRGMSWTAKIIIGLLSTPGVISAFKLFTGG